MIHSLRRKRRGSVALIVLAAVGLIALVATACGSDDGTPASSSSFAQISDSGEIFTLDDLMALGFKESRQYPLDGLPGATTAIFGFWRIPGGDPIDYEVRFYNSHGDAVSLGEALGDEGSGEDAILDDSEATYQHGAKDRRMIIGGGVGGGARSGIGPRYGDYAVFNNTVMLCGGGTGGQALDRCGILANALSDGRSQ